MKIVVTGGLGHIGSRLIREIPEAFPDAEVFILDDLSTQRYCSLFHLPRTGRYRFLEADILEADLPAVFHGAAAVVHLAAITDAPASFSDPVRVESVNLAGTGKVAEACVLVGSPLIFISTTSVYGTQAEVVDEECPREDLKPQSPYAAAKLSAERLLLEKGKEAGLRFLNFRFGTIFGPSIGMRFHTAVNKFCWQAVMGRPLTVWRTALGQQRPYLDLGDAVSAILHSIRIEGYDGLTYNVVTTNTTIGEIVETIRSLVPDLSVEIVDHRIMNQLSYRVLSDRFRKTGFTFRGDLKRGIEDTIAVLGGIRR